MKHKTRELLTRGLELPPDERFLLAQELLRSRAGDKPALADEVAELSSAYGEFLSAPTSTVLGSYPARRFREAARTLDEAGELTDVDLEEVFDEVRDRTQKRRVALAVAQAEADLASLKGGPKVVRLEVELGQDQNGKAMANVRVVLKDHPRGRLYPWKELRPMHELIWRAFNEKASGGPWPFVNFEQESEPEILDNDEAVAV